MKSFVDDMEMNVYFTREFVRAAFSVIDRMNSGDEIWDGWCFDISGHELAENLLDLLDTYY